MTDRVANTEDRPTYDLQTGRRVASPRAILWAVGFSVFVAADDLTVVSTMLRPIISDLGLVLPDGLDDAAWIVNAYLIAFVAIMPIAGRLSDVIGRRRTFVLAYLVFLVGTIWIPLADSLGTLLAGRVLTAIGGGAMVPVALAVVGDVYPVEKRARALGTLGAIETLGWVWGPLYGAMLVRFLSWRWQFWLNIPLAIAGLIAVWWALADHDRARRRVGVDWLGAIFLTIALVSLNVALLGSAEVQSVTGLDELTGNDGTDLRILCPVALVAGVGFVWQQRRVRRRGGDPLIDTELFRGRNVRVALIVNFLVGAALVIAMVDVPLFINAVELDLERSAVISGWILSSLTAAMAIASYVGGRVTERTWYGPPIIIGLFAATVIYAVMGLTWDADSSYPLLALQLGVLGAGFGLTVAPTTSAVVDHAEPDSRGAAAAVVMVVRMVGLSVGLSALTAWGLARFNALRADIELPPLTDPDFESALTAATEQLTAQSIADTFLASATALGVGLVLCLALLRRPRSATPEEREMTTEDTNDTPDTTVPTNANDALSAVADDDADTVETAVVRAGAPLADTDELPTVAVDGDGVAAEPGANSWVQRHLGLVVGGFAALLVVGLTLLVVMFAQLQDTRAELDDTRADLERVEAGAALYASQVNGFVEVLDGLGPSLDDGLDSAIAGLDEFSTSTLEFTVNIDESVKINTDFAIRRDITVPINTSIPINESFDTTITIQGPFGVDIPLDVTVPVDIDVPVDLDVDIPIDETIPVDVDVPVQLDVPLAIAIEGTELAALAESLSDGLRAFEQAVSGLTG
jgi:EmrB/QacA subfamily drug resistance transporter